MDCCTNPSYSENMCEMLYGKVVIKMSEQLEALGNNNGNEEQDIQDSVGCCHLYYECSLEKKCVSLYEETKIKCVYKKNLEKGLIFYSKNANNFLMQKYQELVEKYNSLDSELKDYFNYILHYFINHKRLSEYALFLRTPQIDMLVKKEFLIDDNTHLHIALNNFTFKYLKSLLPENKKMKKNELIDHIIKSDLKAVERFHTKFIYARFDRSLFEYYQEIYFDENINNKVITNFKDFIKSITPDGDYLMKS